MLCPFCEQKIADGSPRCSSPKCGEAIFKGDWSGDLFKYLKVNEDFQGKRQSPKHGVLKSNLLVNGKISLRFAKTCDFNIGSGANCPIQVSTAAAVHVCIHKQRKTNELWVANAFPERPALLNGKTFVNRKLQKGDRITIDGVCLLFDGENLEQTSETSDGLSIEVENMCASESEKQYLTDICFKISSGEFVGVLGPSGCGKSSVLARIVGLAKTNKNAIKMNGKCFEQNKSLFQKVSAYVPQEVALHDDFILEDEIECFCMIHGLKRTQKDIAEVLENVGIRNKLNERIGDFSGGQKRRAGIALELLREPQLLILDEPTAGLDPAAETNVMKLLRKIADHGKTVLCSTHIMGNLNLFDKVLLLSKGYVVFYGTPQELLMYFNISSPIELYQKLAEGDDQHQRAIAEMEHELFLSSKTWKENKQINAVAGKEANGKAPIFREAFCGYLKRQYFDFLNFKNKKTNSFWKRITTFVSSGLFIQIIFQPLLASFVLKFACADNFFHGDHLDLFFFACIAVFWLGLNNSIREIVKERIPWRCIERVEQIPFLSYLSAKVLFAFLISFVQVLIFCCILFFLYADIIAKEDQTDPLVFQFVFFWVLLVTCFSGAMLAMLISACCKKENTAIAWLPLVLIPVLFFSPTIVKENGKDNHYNKIAFSISSFMPCNPPTHYMDFKSKDASDNKLSEMIIYFLVWNILMVSGIYIFQNKQEKAWNGR